MVDIVRTEAIPRSRLIDVADDCIGVVMGYLRLDELAWYCRVCKWMKHQVEQRFRRTKVIDSADWSNQHAREMGVIEMMEKLMPAGATAVVKIGYNGQYYVSDCRYVPGDGTTSVDAGVPCSTRHRAYAGQRRLCAGGAVLRRVPVYHA